MSDQQPREGEAPDIEDPIIEIIDMHKWFGDFHVLNDINLKVGRKERIVISGRRAPASPH